MVDKLKKDMQSTIHKAWEDGFEAAIRTQGDLLGYTTFASDDEFLGSITFNYADDDDYEDVELQIGDLIQTSSLPSRFHYMVCKIEGRDVLAVDPFNHRLISFDAHDIISVGKLVMIDESL